MGPEISRGSLVDGRIFWVRPVGSWVLESITYFVVIMTITDITRTIIARYSHHNNCDHWL